MAEPMSDEDQRHPARRRRREAVPPGKAELDELLDALREKLTPVFSERAGSGLDPAGRDIDELADMMAVAVPRAVSRWDEAAGPFYDTTGVMALLGVTRQAVAGRRDRRQLLSLRSSDGHHLYPVWQFDRKRRVARGLGAVLAVVLPEVVDDWTLASWLNRSRHRELDG